MCDGESDSVCVCLCNVKTDWLFYKAFDGFSPFD